MSGGIRRTLAAAMLAASLVALPATAALAHLRSNTYTVGSNSCTINHNHETSPNKIVWIDSKSGACGLTKARITVFFDGQNLTYESAWANLASISKTLGSYVGGGARVQLNDAGGSVSPWYNH